MPCRWFATSGLRFWSATDFLPLAAQQSPSLQRTISLAASSFLQQSSSLLPHLLSMQQAGSSACSRLSPRDRSLSSPPPCCSPPSPALSCLPSSPRAVVPQSLSRSRADLLPPSPPLHQYPP